MKTKHSARLWPSRLALMALLSGLVLAACGGGDDASGGGDSVGGTVNLVAYSTPQTVYEEELIPAFQETPKGAGVEFTTSFASSGDSRRAIEAGQPTDFAHLALEPDTATLAEAGLIPKDYRAEKFNGSPQTSVVVFITRPEDNIEITDWPDLLEGDLEVINANPFTSGGARWNVMAAYGQALENGASEDEALEFVQQLFERIPVQDASARDALNTFLSGKGDVLLSYENEAIGAINAGEDLEYVIPETTIKIETLDAVTTDAENPEGAEAFRAFLRTDEAQRIWAENGYRPSNEEILAEYEDTLPPVKSLFTINDLGGWDSVMAEFFDLENGKITEIQRDLGVATE